MNHAMNGIDDSTAAGLGVFGLVVFIVGVVLAIIAVVLIIASLISVLIDKDLTGGGKLLWILGILYLPLFGAVAWFVVGKKRSFNRLLGIDKHGPESDAARHAAPRDDAADVSPHFRGATPGTA